jgi:YrbI family 3-deoxy-D-manno-octulosonate 8-phosphate phosphatase
MKFHDNMEILKASFPEVWQKVLEMENTLDEKLVRVVKSKASNMNLKVGKQFIHDKKNIEEAKKIIADQKNVGEQSDIVFYGLGLGYSVDAFMEQYPNTAYTIYEPVAEVFYQFLHHADLMKIPRHLLKNICIENDPEDMVNFCRRFVNQISKSVLVIDLPSYKSIFPEKRQAFFAQFERCINERRISVATNSAFEKLWTINSLKNFIQVLNSPNILLDKKGSFKNKPAILVAAGPSLEEEMGNLKEIQEKGLAYIFSVGTALNTLVQHKIYPHAACTYDPTEKNQIICKEVLEKGIKSIPLIFGSTVGYETLEKYPGPKLHMLINQDTLAAFYFKPEGNERLEFINDATTIAVITLQLLGKLGFDPIILVGQNLAYRDRKNYASGSTYLSFEEVSQQDLINAVLIKDVHGNKVPSNDSYIVMKQQIETCLNSFKDFNVINSTQNGAHIEGTRFQSLDELIKDHLLDRVVEHNWLEYDKCSYDLDYLMGQRRIMSESYESIRSLLEACQRDLDIIIELAESKDPIKINQSYDNFNLNMDKLRKNDFFNTFIAPMTRVELESLILTVPAISAENETVLKAQMMEKEFRPYLLNCAKDINFISPLFQEMNQSIQHLYTIKTIKKKAALIKVLLIDCDGILSDEAIYYSASGDELKKFNLKDRTGILRLQEKGIQIMLINPEANPIIENAAGKLGIKVLYSGITDKKQIMASVQKKYELDLSEIACIFNDISDFELLREVGLSFAVKDSAHNLQNEVDYVLTVNGGQGVIMEIADVIM